MKTAGYASEEYPSAQHSYADLLKQEVIPADEEILRIMAVREMPSYFMMNRY